jgi:hypothetical protein
MARLAFLTVGSLLEAYEHPQVQGFMDRVVNTYASAEGTAGFIWRETEAPPIPALRPHYSREHPFPTETLSLWTDLESPYAFAYNGRHAEALRHRKEWFVKPEWPTYVAWWVDDDHQPTREEGYERLESLHLHGPSPFAFNFKTPFGADGQAAQLNRERVKRLAPTVC